MIDGNLNMNSFEEEGGGLAMRDVVVDKVTYQPTLATISGGKFYNRLLYFSKCCYCGRR